MFNNLFDSFHNTVAEAKEEREQLDRLLTISTPRERILVVAIALLLVILAAWLFFGSVARTVSMGGVLVQPGENLNEGSHSVQALVWVGRGVALQIKAGMPAAIELSAAGGEASTLEGKIETISAASLSDGLAEAEIAAPVSMRRIVIVLDKKLEIASLANLKCRIIVELGTLSPVNILRMRQS